jgi:hypothetical protein
MVNERLVHSGRMVANSRLFLAIWITLAAAMCNAIPTGKAAQSMCIIYLLMRVFEQYLMVRLEQTYT